MKPSTRVFKFTDVSERELIRQEAADANATGFIDSAAPLLKWVLSVAAAIGSVFVIVHGDL